jgi:hypothetical protein
MWCLLQSQSGRATAKQAVTADQGRCRWHPRRLLRPYCRGMGRLRSGVVIWSAGKIGKRSLFWTSSRRMKLAAAWNFLLRTQIFARNSLAVTNLASNSNFNVSDTSNPHENPAFYNSFIPHLKFQFLST